MILLSLLNSLIEGIYPITIVTYLVATVHSDEIKNQ